MSYTVEKPNPQLFASQSSDPISSAHADSICWNCIHASPSQTTGCSWSKRFVPVSGSTYLPGGKLPLNQGRGIIVTSCPKYQQLHQFTLNSEVVRHLMNHFKINQYHFKKTPFYWVSKYQKECKKDPNLTPLPEWFLIEMEELKARQKEGLPLKRRAEK